MTANVSVSFSANVSQFVAAQNKMTAAQRANANATNQQTQAQRQLNAAMAQGKAMGGGGGGGGGPNLGFGAGQGMPGGRGAGNVIARGNTGPGNGNNSRGTGQDYGARGARGMFQQFGGEKAGMRGQMVGDIAAGLGIPGVGMGSVAIGAGIFAGIEITANLAAAAMQRLSDAANATADKQRFLSSEMDKATKTGRSRLTEDIPLEAWMKLSADERKRYVEERKKEESLGIDVLVNEIRRTINPGRYRDAAVGQRFKDLGGSVDPVAVAEQERQAIEAQKYADRVKGVLDKEYWEGVGDILKTAFMGAKDETGARTGGPDRAFIKTSRKLPASLRGE